VHHDEVSKYLQAADITIFPMKEPQCGLSMAALESQVLGVPIITTNVGDMKEIVLEGHTGFVAGGTVDSFVSWVEKFFSFDNEIKLLMSKCSRQLVVEKFSDVRMNEDFRRVIDGNSSSR
jgi:glycosyltransferase involved in cell wall biosynthesis